MSFHVVQLLCLERLPLKQAQARPKEVYHKTATAWPTCNKTGMKGGRKREFYSRHSTRARSGPMGQLKVRAGRHQISNRVEGTSSDDSPGKRGITGGD